MQLWPIIGPADTVMYMHGEFSIQMFVHKIAHHSPGERGFVLTPLCIITHDHAFFNLMLLYLFLRGTVLILELFDLSKKKILELLIRLMGHFR
jgi:hypothetical protein